MTVLTIVPFINEPGRLQMYPIYPFYRMNILKLEFNDLIVYSGK